MKSLTVRGITPEIEKRLRQQAAERHTSLSRAALSLMEAGIGSRPKEKKLHHDLDFLIGSWTKEEADDFDRRLKESRKPDPKDWL